MTNTVSVGDFLTDKEIRKAKSLYDLYHDTGTLNKRLVEEIVSPNLNRIEKTIGQKMDARYVGYMIEYAFHAAGLARAKGLN